MLATIGTCTCPSPSSTTYISHSFISYFPSLHVYFLYPHSAPTIPFLYLKYIYLPSFFITPITPTTSPPFYTSALSPLSLHHRLHSLPYLSPSFCIYPLSTFYTAPTDASFNESMSTLRYIERAKFITTCAVINETSQDPAFVAMLQKQVQQLRESLTAAQAQVTPIPP